MPHFIPPYSYFRNVALQARVPLLGLSMLSGDIVVAASGATREEKWASTYVCDGTDDDVWIQKALDEVPNRGSILLVGPQFNIGATLYFKQTCALRGQSRGICIRTQDGANLNAMVAMFTLIGDCTLGDLTLDGNRANQAGGVGLIIDAANAHPYVLENLSLINAYGDAIGRSAANSSQCVLSDIYIFYPQGAGISIIDSINNAWGWSLVNVTIDNAGTYGIYFEDTDVAPATDSMWDGSVVVIRGSTIADMFWAGSNSIFSGLVLDSSAPSQLILTGIRCRGNTFVLGISEPFPYAGTAVAVDVSGATDAVEYNNILGTIFHCLNAYSFSALTGTVNHNVFAAAVDVGSVANLVSGAMGPLDLIRSGWGYRVGVGGFFLAGYYNSDVQPSVTLDGVGGLRLGAGGALAQDVNLYRSAADTLKTDDAFVIARNLQFTGLGVGLAGGANNDVAIVAASFVRFTGPVAAFGVTGFANPIAGRVLIVFHTIAQQFTIYNENVGSVAANRITTLTGADVVVPAGAGTAATFIYSGGAARWILIGVRPGGG